MTNCCRSSAHTLCTARSYMPARAIPIITYAHVRAAVGGRRPDRRQRPRRRRRQQQQPLLHNRTWALYLLCVNSRRNILYLIVYALASVCVCVRVCGYGVCPTEHHTRSSQVAADIPLSHHPLIARLKSWRWWYDAAGGIGFLTQN